IGHRATAECSGVSEPGEPRSGSTSGDGMDPRPAADPGAQAAGPEPRDRGGADAAATAEAAPSEEVAAPPPRGGRLARSTAFFSFATALSRIAGLVREIVAASFFGIRGPMSAFTIAFLAPNTI